MVSPADTQAAAAAPAADPLTPAIGLHLQDLSVQRDGRTLLQPLTLDLPAGRMTAVLGPNGSGKSTLLKALAGLLPHGGQRRWPDGTPPRIAFLPQDHHSPSALTVLEALLLGRLDRLGLRVGPQDRAAVDRVIGPLGLAPLLQRPLGQLSGGQRQRVFIAQALVREARVLLLDEPLSALDLQHQAQVMALLRTLTEAHGLTTVIVLHDLNVARARCDQALLLRDGRLHGHGPAATLLRPPVLEDVFQVRWVEARSACGREGLLDGG
ncbi:MAG: hypothetical protein RIQ53_1652 [Pseudomonadota bacterium]